MIETEVAIVGGGPAGMMLSVLLARAGIAHCVLERNDDFEREYRGEVLMPRFARLLRQLDLESLFSGLPHRTLDGLALHWRDRPLAKFKLARVAPEFPFAYWVPQPVMLSALAKEAGKHPCHQMLFGAVVKDLRKENDRVTGVVVERDGERVEVSSRVVVGCDGRFSSLRRLGQFEIEYEQHDFDVLWFTLPDEGGEQAAFRAFLTGPRPYLALPKLPHHVQCGMMLPPNGYGAYRKAGIESLRAHLLEGPRFFHDFARKLEDFSPFTLLHANLDLVKDWERNGLVLIGDAAHTCSPAGAIGVSIAVETAAVAAEVLVGCHSRGDYSKAALDEIQRRREPAVREIHDRQRVIGRNLAGSPTARRIASWVLPWIARTGIVERVLRPVVYGDPVELAPPRR